MNADTKHPPATPVMEFGGRSYLTDSQGSLVPLESVRPQDKLMDELVGDLTGRAREVSETLRAFRALAFAAIADYQALLDQEYGSKAGGKKGNVTLMSFDGRTRVTIQIADRIDFGPELQVAKKLVDECLIEWSTDSRAELRAFVNRAFQVDQTGKINKADLFSILRFEVEDERWQNAMKAIRDSMRVVGTKEYIRFHVRPDPSSGWTHLPLDIASV